MNDDSNFIMSVESKAIDLGFDDVGFCKAHIPPITRKRLIEFIDRGRHGEMSWMSEKLYTRMNPTNMWGEAKTAGYYPKREAKQKFLWILPHLWKSPLQKHLVWVG